MAWCPKCRLEYREDIKVCSDCGSELVAELEKEMAVVCKTYEEEIALQLAEYLKSEMDGVEFSYDTKEECYVVSVPAHEQKKAMKMRAGFIQAQEELKSLQKQQEQNTKQTETELWEETVADLENSFDEEEQASLRKSAKVFTRKEDQYKDLTSTAYSFFIVGCLGMVFWILNIAGVIQYFNNILSYTVSGGMFLAFIIVGIVTYFSSKKTKAAISEENAFINQVNDWLTANITQNQLDAIHDETLTAEENFLNNMDYIKECLTKEFGELEESFLDSIVEEFYNKNFE